MMEGKLGKLLGGARRKRLGHGLELRLLSAREVLEARREAEGLSRDGAERALCANAVCWPGRWNGTGGRCTATARRFWRD